MVAQSDKEFDQLEVDHSHHLMKGELPSELLWDGSVFDDIYRTRPTENNWIRIHGRDVQIPRGQQSFGATYHFSGQDNHALPVPDLLRPLLTWVRDNVDHRLNGMLLNYYSGRDEYIGAHHDSTKHLISDTPIVTVSFGEERVFRLSPGTRIEGSNRDFVAEPGSVIVIPWRLNRTWKHGVPKRARYSGQRISVTLRAFSEGVLPAESYFENLTDGLSALRQK